MPGRFRLMSISNEGNQKLFLTQETRLFHILGWTVASVSTALGVFFVSAQSTVVWDKNYGSEDLYTSRVIDLEPVGLVLLGAGILSLVALCIVEVLLRRPRQ